ncbi:MAG: class I SAM-dependent methyltransferase [bacterium]
MMSPSAYRRRTRASVLTLLTLLLPCSYVTAGAQVVGRDVPYVPTPARVVEMMLEMGEAGSEDVLYDLGSGDGRIVIAAVRDRGVGRAVGIDIDPVRIAESERNARAAGVEGHCRFVRGDIFEMDFSAATVLTMYLLPEVNIRLRPRILAELEPGTRVVSHQFDLGDWRPDDYRTYRRHSVMMWVVPAGVEGTWEGQAELGRVRLKLSQEFQEVEGEIRISGQGVDILEAVLRGRELRISGIRERQDEIVLIRFEGSVEGDILTGRVTAGDEPIPYTLRRLPDSPF